MDQEFISYTHDWQYRMQATGSIAVTVGIPTYSRLNYLRESAASALAQAHPGFEVLISQNPHPDQAIRDEIAKYCEELAASDSRVRYQLLPMDVGPPANFNAIADAARGKYLMMIGDDDRLLPNAIQTLTSSLGPKTVLAFGRRYVIDSKGERLETYSSGLDRAHSAPAVVTQTQPGGFGPPPAGRLINPELWAWQQAMATETSLIRTDAFRRLRFRESVDIPDMEFFIMLAREGEEFIFTPEYVTEIRVHGDSTTGKGFVNYRELVDLLALLEVSGEIEPEKTRKLIDLTHLAVIRSMLTGNVDDARRLLNTRYFGERALPTRLCASLPGKLAPPVYKAYRWLRSASESIGLLQ
jgi:glycosyltransferase involved in cell wall biosynthesis